jgi:hypothetical protein
MAYKDICDGIMNYMLGMTENKPFHSFKKYKKIVGDKLGPFDEELWELFYPCLKDEGDNYKNKSITQPTLQNLKFRLGHYKKLAYIKKLASLYLAVPARHAARQRPVALAGAKALYKNATARIF